ncbi:hypothetical protein N9L64_06035 [Flavobacteriaceae bacterium]|nr:hypothetical protein [Flavobacteriaceae bacterium]
MYLKKIVTIIFVLVSSFAVAQVPTWSVNESLYEFNMTFVAKLNIDGQPLNSSSDIVGAFVGDECRGVSNPTYISSSDAYFLYLTVFGASAGETITFKVYRAETNEVIEITNTIEFESNQHIGSRFQSFSIADPPLRSEAELISFGFNNHTADSLSITEDSMNFYFFSDIDKQALTPNFEISDGAKIFINQSEQISGVGVRDFSDSVVYQILSEDESILNEISINVFDVYNQGSEETDPPDEDDDDGGGSNTGSRPSYNISQSNNNSIVSEDETQDNFIVFLSQQPSNQAVFTISSSNPDEVIVVNSEIIFTPDNVNLAQFVYLQGVDDNVQDGNQTSSITIQVDPTRSDLAFASLAPKIITCITLDNDNVPSIVILETNGSTQVDESQSEDTFFISLGTEPNSVVNMSIEVADITEVSVQNSSLQFTTQNWYIPQEIIVSGVDDDLVDGSQKSDLIIRVESDTEDTNYTSLDPVSIEVITTDNDASTNNGDGGDNVDDNGETDVDTNPVSSPVFYKRNAVCYNGGQIKVEYAPSGTAVTLNLNGRLVNTRSISNGEVIFSDLEQGTYVVEVANVVKVINIDLDE